MCVKELLLAISEREQVEVAAITAKGENRWVGIMIGCLRTEVNGYSIDHLGGYDAHITLGYFPSDEEAPTRMEMTMYMAELDSIVEQCFKSCTTTTIQCSEKPDTDGLRVDEGQLRHSFFAEMLISCEMYQKLCRITNAWRPPNFQRKRCFHVQTFPFVSAY